MPSYSFQCVVCYRETELILPFSESQSVQPCEPECPGSMPRLIKMPNIQTDDTFGIGGHYSVQTDTTMSGSEYKKWVKKVKREAKEKGREVFVGEGAGGKRDDRGQQIADDVSKHGRAALDHYRLESKLDQQKKSLASKESVS